MMTLQWIGRYLLLALLAVQLGVSLGLAAPANGQGLGTAAPPPRGWPLGYYDEGMGRLWERIDVPGASCGNGTPYAFFFSAASRREGEDRLTIYFQGGGSTVLLDSGLSSAITSLKPLDARLNAPLSYRGAKRLFMDRHPENDRFIGPGNWAYFPYCTQDRQVGRRTDSYAYDFTQAPGSLRRDVEKLLNAGQSVTRIETDHPGLEIAEVHLFRQGDKVVGKLLVHITHRGALNVELANQVLRDRLAVASFPDAPLPTADRRSKGSFEVRELRVMTNPRGISG